MSNWDKLVSEDDLDRVKRERKKPYIDKKIRRDSLPGLEKEGWELLSEYKDRRYVKVRKDKRLDEQFENRVWILFSNMGYTTMNEDSTFVISYGKDPSLTKQIDIFAYDGETVLVVECKSAEESGTSKDFKTELESLNCIKEKVRGEIRNHFGRGVKVKFIFATQNYIVGGMDKKRLAEFDIEHFDEEAIDYYIELAQHLGPISKYQLLGKIFANTKIENMVETVPAIQGVMGGHTYYSFSIEPERLLKIGYVLHRSDANRTMMPTYQRVIKKSRLDSVRDFVDKGGYFPNSIIISIDAPKKGLTFDSKSGDDNSIAKLGILHLPKKYRSAYIIDGQHRLYGYSNSEYAKSNTIPVVAFENLEKEEQIRLFMDINENQKAVPKNLRNTLSADLLWASNNYSERRRAVRLRIAQSLGEDPDSPLRGHVLIGENKKSAIRCVTMDSIERGIGAGRFLTRFDKSNQPIEPLGIYDNGSPDNDFAFQHLTEFLKCAFGFFRLELPEEWEQGEDNQGILTNNSGIYALLHIFSDTLDFLEEKTNASPKNQHLNQVMASARPFFDAIVNFYKTLSPELRNEIKTQYGGNGPTQHWRYLQKAIHDEIAEFSPQGFESWWADNSKQYNDASKTMLDEIRNEIVSRIRSFIFENNYELPFAMKMTLGAKALNENEKRERNNEELCDEWSFFTLNDCVTLAQSPGGLWSDGLKDLLTRPEQQGRKNGDKTVKTRWLADMHKIQNGLNHSGYSVKQADYEYISSIYRWVIRKEPVAPDETGDNH